MTKDQLRDYRVIKKELDNLEVIARKVDRYGTPELQAFYKRKRAKLTRELLKIEKVIESLRPVERTLMRLRYIEGLSWRAISLRINYSEPWTKDLHAQALKKIKNIKE